MDRIKFEKDVLEVLKNHRFQSENVTKIRIEIEVGGLFLVNIESKIPK